jgi:hypothetical protein
MKPIIPHLFSSPDNQPLASLLAYKHDNGNVRRMKKQQKTIDPHTFEIHLLQEKQP